MKTDVIIIGAGPGGGMAACHLAKKGMKVIILEKRKLPRVKACGGAIWSGMKTFFDWDITPFIENEVSSIKYVFNHAMPKELNLTTPSFLMVNRSSFDHHLIQKAVSQGKGDIELIENFHVVRVEENGKEVTVYDNNQTKIKADFVIAADGPFSKTARSMGLNKSISYGLAIDARVEVIPEIFESQKDCAVFNFFCLPRGYGWIFPKNGYLSCGVGSWQVLKQPTLPKAMNTFLKKSFPSDVVISTKQIGHPIPIYSGHRDIATERICLVGDAANLIDPIMGEGIRYALKSAVYAAEVISFLAGCKSDPNINLENVSWENGGCRSYQTHIHEGMGANLDILYRYALPVFLDAPEFFYRKFVIEGHSYLSYFKHIAAQLKTKEKSF